MTPAIKPSKSKLKPWMLQQVQSLGSKPVLKVLLQKCYSYLLADEHLASIEAQSDVVDGPWQKLNLEEFKAKLDRFGVYGGIAILLPSLNLCKFAIETNDPYDIQLHDYAKFHSGWRQPLTTTAPENVDGTWLHLREITVLVHTTDEPEFGRLKAANLDLQHWALIWQYCHTIETTTDPNSVAIQLLRNSLRHYPVTFEWMRVSFQI